MAISPRRSGDHLHLPRHHANQLTAPPQLAPTLCHLSPTNGSWSAARNRRQAILPSLSWLFEKVFVQSPIAQTHLPHAEKEKRSLQLSITIAESHIFPPSFSADLLPYCIELHVCMKPLSSSNRLVTCFNGRPTTLQLTSPIVERDCRNAHATSYSSVT